MDSNLFEIVAEFEQRPHAGGTPCIICHADSRYMLRVHPYLFHMIEGKQQDLHFCPIHIKNPHDMVDLWCTEIGRSIDDVVFYFMDAMLRFERENRISIEPSVFPAACEDMCSLCGQRASHFMTISARSAHMKPWRYSMYSRMTCERHCYEEYIQMRLQALYERVYNMLIVQAIRRMPGQSSSDSKP